MDMMNIQEIINKGVQVGLNGKALSLLLSTTAFPMIALIEKKGVRHNKACKPKNVCKHNHACLKKNNNCPDEE